MRRLLRKAGGASGGRRGGEATSLFPLLLPGSPNFIPGLSPGSCLLPSPPPFSQHLHTKPGPEVGPGERELAPAPGGRVRAVGTDGRSAGPWQAPG